MTDKPFCITTKSIFYMYFVHKFIFYKEFRFIDTEKNCWAYYEYYFG